MLSLRLLMLSTLFLFLSACATRPYIYPLPYAPISTNEKTFTFLTKNKFNSQLKRELERQGFIIRKALPKEKKKAQNRLLNHLNKKARYGIKLKYDKPTDICLLNSDIKTNVYAEIIDLRLDQVIFILRNSGWTGDCGWNKGNIFKDMALNIKKEWRKWR